MRELIRQLPSSVVAEQTESFELYQRVIDHHRTSKNKVYSLHESDVYCVGKGKDHKKYEYGRKASVVSIKDNKSGCCAVGERRLNRLSGT